MKVLVEYQETYNHYFYVDVPENTDDIQDYVDEHREDYESEMSKTELSDSVLNAIGEVVSYRIEYIPQRWSGNHVDYYNVVLEAKANGDYWYRDFSYKPTNIVPDFEAEAYLILDNHLDPELVEVCRPEGGDNA